MKDKIDVKIIVCIVLLFLLILSIVLLMKSNKKSIVGSWKYEKSDYIYTFKEDGTGRYYAIGTVMTFTYKVEKNMVSILYTGEEKPMNCLFRLKNDKLIIDDSLGNDTVYVKYVVGN